MKRVLIVLLILTICLSFGYVALESVHDCEREADCPICKIIAVLSRILSFVAVCFISILCFALLSSDNCPLKARESTSSTLISLRVKLSS